MNKDVKDKLAAYTKEGVRQIHLGLVDIDGVLRGKFIDLEKFASLVESGGGFCDCILGWDVADQLYDNASFTGWHTAFPDTHYKLDLSTERRVAEGSPFFLGELVDKESNGLHPICPRSLLKKVLQRAKGMGFDIQASLEYEFFIFDETSDSIREKNYQNLTPLSPGMFGYSVLRESVFSELFQEFFAYCQDMNFPIEGLHCETGPGVWEAALKHSDALEAADRAALFKTFCKSFFQKRGYMVTFMAKWSMEYPGQSGHIHQSLFDAKTGDSVFYDENAPFQMSQTMSHYVAGQLEYMKSFLALCAPTINSYTRLVKGAWAPTSATWGVENRTTALRVIPGKAQSQRVEFRIGSADANPYLALAANLAAGLMGIERKLALPDPVKGNAYDIQDDLPLEKQLPTNLRDSFGCLKRSDEAKECFGKEFVEHYVSSREWECREYEKSVTDWQLKRYFEII